MKPHEVIDMKNFLASEILKFFGTKYSVEIAEWLIEFGWVTGTPTGEELE